MTGSEGVVPGASHGDDGSGEVLPWSVRPVTEFDATADKCFFLDLHDGSRMCDHAEGDSACLITRYDAGDDAAARQLQMILFGDVTPPCPDCGRNGRCEHDADQSPAAKVHRGGRMSTSEQPNACGNDQ